MLIGITADGWMSAYLNNTKLLRGQCPGPPSLEGVDDAIMQHPVGVRAMWREDPAR
jgi:hypothetical protein